MVTSGEMTVRSTANCLEVGKVGLDKIQSESVKMAVFDLDAREETKRGYYFMVQEGRIFTDCKIVDE